MSLVGIGLCLLVVVGCIVGIILEVVGYLLDKIIMNVTFEKLLNFEIKKGVKR